MNRDIPLASPDMGLWRTEWGQISNFSFGEGQVAGIGERCRKSGKTVLPGRPALKIRDGEGRRDGGKKTQKI